MRLAINGFGRIGRCFLRAALEKGENFDIVCINDLAPVDTLAHLLKYDTTFGELEEKVETSNNKLIVGDLEIDFVSERNPEELPWSEKDVDLALEATGLFRKRQDAAKHLEAGAEKVLITAPGKGEGTDITLIPGVNNNEYDPDKHVIMDLGSCTTNCLVPTVKVLDDEFGLEKGLMTTVHAYTNAQQLLDGVHSDLRRARAAAASIIPTTTGAAIATTKVLPHLEGKLHGIAMRVPTLDASIVDLVASVSDEVDEETINSTYKDAAEGKLEGILGYTETPLVSSDYIGDPRSAVVDGEFTTVRGNNLVKVLSWYDNEWGYSNRLVDMANQIAKEMG
ncbi:glyceraldehyde-3-phosphate dehydrogenase [candidate division MSBL1 archaeon SCGC-AAA259I09]|uniref:glyceraldehyde-3-phosphate dehydrogenase (NAD(P)(+)) (phosphorylating) n=1 Tax=candidate division MSBL1 archaeon SCGC-AAA259I09 TaxID=1698267 RepID=A0A133UL46_9EURY|nr:glyceraldehyde-3-phosphate dehydrogenase [candidate division MSBL1 archaeon SCGC-AAA259I09]